MNLNILKSLETYCQMTFQKVYSSHTPTARNIFTINSAEHLIVPSLISKSWDLALVTGKMCFLAFVIRKLEEQVLALKLNIKQQLHILDLLT